MKYLIGTIIGGLACALFYWGGRYDESIKLPKAPVSWSRWSEPKVTSNLFDGTNLWQQRTNLDTGEIELRCQRVSEHGGHPQ